MRVTMKMKRATNNHQMDKWYERDHWPYTEDRKLTDQYAEWLKPIPWQLFCTFTFAWRVSDAQGNNIFAEYINLLERYLGCDVGYVRGHEKRISGVGKPASGRHYHALLTAAAPINA